jgi:hypothetical protein
MGMMIPPVVKGFSVDLGDVDTEHGSTSTA